MQNLAGGASFWDAVHVNFGRELLNAVFKVHHLVAVCVDVESDEVGVHELVPSYVEVHEPQLDLLVVLEAVRVRPHFLDVLVFRYHV